jgi:hypothetical protein
VFKLGKWSDLNNNIIVSLDSDTFVNTSVKGRSGSTICDGSNKDLVYTFDRYFIGHIKKDITLTVTAGGGVAVRNINLILKDCDDCLAGQLSYSVEYMPVYSRNNQYRAMNTWITFNKDILEPEVVRSNFHIAINNISLTITESEFIYDLRLYTPLEFGFINGTE